MGWKQLCFGRANVMPWQLQSSALTACSRSTTTWLSARVPLPCPLAWLLPQMVFPALDKLRPDASPEQTGSRATAAQRRKERPLVGHQVVKPDLQQTRFRPSPEFLLNTFGRLELYPGTGMSQVKRSRKLLLCQLKRLPEVATARMRLSVALVSA